MTEKRSATKQLTLIRTAQDAERERRKLKSIWSRESQLSQQVLIRCMDLLEEIAANTRRRTKGRPTAWSKFLGEQMRQGLTPTQASKLWQAQKKKAS